MPHICCRDMHRCKRGRSRLALSTCTCMAATVVRIAVSNMVAQHGSRLMCWLSSGSVPAGAWDEQSLAEVGREGLLPLQTAMQALTDPGRTSEPDELEQVMQMAAMRILAGIALVHEVIDSRKSKLMS